jgi:hypothetical protein
MKWAAMSAVVATAALLAACGGSGSSSSAQVRLINASAGYNSLDLTVNNTSISTGTAYGAAGSYGTVDTSATGTQVINSGTTVISGTLTGLVGNNKYSMIAYGWPGAMGYRLLSETEPAPASGSAKLLVLNLAPDAGTVNVYLTTGAPATGAAAFASSVVGGSGSGYLLTNAGTYHVRVTGSASSDVNTDIRLDIPAITLDSASVNTLILTPTQGGVLVNAMTVVQTGAVASYGGTNARVRVINSVVGTANPNVTVVASRNGNTLLDTTAAAPIGFYQIVPATNDPISVSVNGVAQPVNTTALAAGSDYTVLVSGTDTAPQLAVIPDDNRLPLNGYAKFRLINGAANAGQVMTMSLNFSPIASNVAIGTASTPFATIATAGANLSVNTLNSAQAVFSQSNFTMANQGVYTVYMLGNSTGTNNLVGELRQDR